MRRAPERFVAQRKIRQLQRAAAARPGHHRKLNGTNPGRRSAARRPPGKGQVALAHLQRRPRCRPRAIRLHIAPHIRPAGIHHFELEVVGRAVPAQPEAKGKRLGQVQPQLLADDHKAAATVKINLEPQPGLARGTAQRAHAPLRLTGGGHLPAGGIAKHGGGR